MSDPTEPAVRHAPREVYPGAPLRAVAIELRFRRMLDAVSRFGAFQRRRPEFRATVPDDNDDSETVLLLDERSDKGVAISPTILSVITYSYADGFDGFRRWAMPIIEEGVSLLDISPFTGVVYRYENVIKGVEGLSQILSLQLPAPESAAVSPLVYAIWTQEWPAGHVHVDVTSTPSEDDDDKDVETYDLNVDISAWSKGPVSKDDLGAALEEAHRMGRLAFENLITSEFRDRLRRGGA